MSIIAILSQEKISYQNLSIVIYFFRVPGKNHQPLASKLSRIFWREIQTYATRGAVMIHKMALQTTEHLFQKFKRLADNLNHKLTWFYCCCRWQQCSLNNWILTRVTPIRATAICTVVSSTGYQFITVFFLHTSLTCHSCTI